MLCVYIQYIYRERENIDSVSQVQTVVSGVWRWQMSLIPPSPPICARSLINRSIWWFWRVMPAAPWGAANSVLGQALAPHI